MESADAAQALLIANAPLEEADELYLLAALERARLAGVPVVGVDGGTHHLLRLGMLPGIVTGDFDSLDAATRADLAERGVRIVPTPDQDYTDLDKAIVFARGELGATRIRVHAASRGRLDHLFSVLSAIVKHGREADVRLVDAIGETWRVRGQETLTGEDLLGRTLSLLALGLVTGITTTGVQWPLTDELLAPGVRDGTLNRIVYPTVTIRVGSGDLLVNLHHPSTSE